jgi:uncharacterized DUF497 family protein
MDLTFEWDRRKATANHRKHGVTFEEAATVFRDRLSLTVNDPDHSEDEDRFITIGVSEEENTLVVVHNDRGQNVRIISARKADRQERKDYEDLPPEQR